MPVVRQPILNEEEEARLKTELTPLWEKGLTAREITYALQFGVEGSRYEKLQMYHVYFYRGKLGLKPRRFKPSGMPRYKDKKDEMMLPEEFFEVLNKKLFKFDFFGKRMRSYLILHFWTPLRKSEIYERTIDDFEIKKGRLIIHLLRKKKKYPKSVKDEPFFVPLGFPLMDEVVEYLRNREWEDTDENPEGRPWNISSTTAWLYVSEVFKGYYPHFFRFNWITEATDDRETSLAELSAKTGLHISTLNAYIMSSARIQDKMDARKLKRLNSLGLSKPDGLGASSLKRDRGRPRRKKKKKKKKKNIEKMIKMISQEPMEKKVEEKIEKKQEEKKAVNIWEELEDL